MKIGFIGDIHANLAALTSVLSYLRTEKCTKIICLGDIVGYGPRPQECVDLIRALQIPTVMGNHDDWIGTYLRLAGTSDHVRDMIIWTKKQLTPESVAWLKALPLRDSYGGIDFTHSSNCPDNKYWPYVRDLPSLAENFRHQKSPICFYGHTHRPAFGVFREGEQPYFAKLESVMHIPTGYKVLINPGSVGQPRDGDPRAACAIYNTKDQTVHFIRVEYDIKRTQDEMTLAGLPEPYIKRLLKGT